MDPQTLIHRKLFCPGRRGLFISLLPLLTIRLSLRFEDVANIFSTPAESGFANERRLIEGTIDLSLRSGATLGLSPAHSGIGSTTRTTSGTTV
ncbi:hypothetical protein L610_005000000160 [Aminobacter sp. J44]|nr:hypothetical protein L610_005000000160 [Aminobacter sp. J44]